MNTTDIQHRRKLSFLSRSKRPTEPTVSMVTSLLPREAFESAPEAVQAYDEFVRSRDAAHEHERTAGRERNAATTAKGAYREKVAAAIAAGEDPGKIRDKTSEHEAAAAAHAELAQTARHKATHAAREFAFAAAEAAGDLLEPSEARLTDAATTMREALDHLSNAWRDYALAWQERRILGDLALYGGRLANYDPNQPLPTDIRQALGELGDRLNDLDRLREDEATIRAERAKGVHV